MKLVSFVEHMIVVEVSSCLMCNMLQTLEVVVECRNLWCSLVDRLMFVQDS